MSAMQAFDYLIVVSFCVDKEKNAFLGFPWVVIQTATKQITDSHQVVVSSRPPSSSKTETTVETFQKTLQKFDTYIVQNFLNKKKQFCLVLSDEQTNIQDCLSKASSGMKLASHYSRFVDMDKVVSEETKNAYYKLKNEANSNVDSAMQFCKELAQHTIQLLQQGYTFLRKVEQDGSIKVEVQQNSSASAQKEPASPPKDTVPTTNTPEKPQLPQVSSSVVRLRGLPWSATEEDIAQFFAGINMIKEGAILIVLNSNGKSSGEAYVCFENPIEAEKAFKRDRQVMGYRYIEIFPSSRLEMEYMRKLISKGIGELQNSTVVRMRGLPFHIKVEDIELFFDKLAIKKTNDFLHVCIVLNHYGTPSGEAYVEFVDVETVKEALKRNKEKIGNRYIELFKSTRYDYDTACYTNNYILQQMQYHSAYASVEGVANTDHVVRLRGLPFQSDEEEIAKFFEGLQIASNGIHLVMNAQNKPVGEAFVEFATDADVEKALEKNKQMIRHRYIEVFQSDQYEMRSAFGQTNNAPAQNVPAYLYNPSIMTAWKPPSQQQTPSVPSYATVASNHKQYQPQQQGVYSNGHHSNKTWVRNK